MSNINDSLDQLMSLTGAMAACLVDMQSGMSLGAVGNAGMDLEIAAAGNSEVLKSKLKVMTNLGLKDDIEDVLITLGKQYHLLRLMRSHKNLFIYYVLNKQSANLALARHKLTEVEGAIEV